MSNLFARFCTASLLWGLFYAATVSGLGPYVAFFGFFLAWSAVFEWPQLTSSWPWRARYGFGFVYFCTPIIILKYLYESYFGVTMTAILYPVLAALVCDSAAYFVGRFFGSHYAFPIISPKKTYEGLIAGFLAVFAFHLYLSSVLSFASGYLGWILKYPLSSGVLMALAAIFGDLSISVLKRRARVKDSGTLFPGHGGALDRGGSLIFVVFAIGVLMLCVH